MSNAEFVPPLRGVMEYRAKPFADVLQVVDLLITASCAFSGTPKFLIDCPVNIGRLEKVENDNSLHYNIFLMTDTLSSMTCSRDTCRQGLSTIGIRRRVFRRLLKALFSHYKRNTADESRGQR
ncbi:hypothetical protein CEXT_104971 [Caerostris extrusa]|uniref:Uncharacterized protein n=1 Tax=Caerostris extrusa TaxID=172846 RepID=A0AAV4TC72_CAEEX|nr:hypothetical protein CEXT_104971 [Caerostris extrusa]